LSITVAAPVQERLELRSSLPLISFFGARTGPTASPPPMPMDGFTPAPSSRATQLHFSAIWEALHGPASRRNTAAMYRQGPPAAPAFRGQLTSPILASSSRGFGPIPPQSLLTLLRPA